MANGDDDEQTVHIEKTDDEEEINARNEVSIFINDFDSTSNKNKQVILKDKNLSAEYLLKLAKDTLREDFRIKPVDPKTSKTQPGTG